jgi:hypothetical protein
MNSQHRFVLTGVAAVVVVFLSDLALAQGVSFGAPHHASGIMPQSGVVAWIFAGSFLPFNVQLHPCEQGWRSRDMGPVRHLPISRPGLRMCGGATCADKPLIGPPIMR